MTKAKIVLISILMILIALIAILFGAVFRVRNQTLICVGEGKTYCEELEQEILTSSGIKNGKSIFMLDKQTAVLNIEKTHPYVKVIQIQTTGVTSIEIKVRKRYEMFYAVANGKNYVLDEDLKVLRITDVVPELMFLNVSKLSITNNTEVGDFIGTEYHQNVASALVEGLYTHALLERNEMISSIEKISFGEGFSLNEGYTRLIIKTKTGVEMDIYKPEQNLAEKLNICFSTYNDEDFTSEQKTQGVIKIYLDKFGNEKIGYFEPTE